MDNELTALERALTKKDLSAMIDPLQSVLRALKPMRLSSLEQLDSGARGRLLTTLMRVQRMDKPAVEAAPEAPAAEAPAAEAAPAEAPAEGAAPVEAAPATPAPAPEKKANPYSDVQFTIGLIWSSIQEKDRADVAFGKAERQPTEAELAAPPVQERPAQSDRPERGPRKDRGERGERRERSDRPARAARPERPERPAPFVSSGDWQADVKKLEELGRTRDAGRIHEKNQSYADAARLYETGGDTKSALRNAALGKLDDVFKRLSEKLKPEEISEALERAGAFEKLMEFHVARGDFDSIAKLYERANQFDQAGLAWERAGKFSFARKSYERAKDFAGANRVRDLEIAKLIERGDRLGAATLLVAANKKAEALETIKPLPGPKAFHFMQKLKLNAEADAFAKEELAKAEAANNALQKARWLELTGKHQEAADVYLAADRKDKAAFVFEAMGQLGKAAELLEAAGQLDKAQALFTKAGDAANADRVKALPRPEPKPKAVEAKSEGEGEQIPPPSPSAPTPGSTANA
ncbi:MAG: DEAD/DEAH box helicase [Archangium gephyra]|uniref:DEAD/DEAH box helicase n=1 Tax=Archangium gephyra TaxID=48 RepID=A0A2W5VPL6_9BACT|nr:MAG: DEAD/DEAH box helicase [Archangium gephyra]